MFDLIKNKYEEHREMEDRAAIVAPDEGNKYNITTIVLLVVLYIVPISLIVYGATHLKDCPAENMVAISLIVLGGLSLLSRLVSSPYEWREAFGITDIQKRISLICINVLLQFVIMGWFFSLCYWILKMDPDTKPEDHDAPNYCSSEFYRNIYWGSIVGLVLFGLMFISSCGIACYIASKL